jgi:hypothetical protein
VALGTCLTGTAASAQGVARADSAVDEKPTSRLTPDVLAQIPAAGTQSGAIAAAPVDTTLGAGIDVLVMTVGPGSNVWERFGHNAIRIRDRAHGVDVAYNWGTFDFNQPNFLTRFLRGNTEYWMVGNDASADIAKYIDENRSVWVQELNLTPTQRAQLARFVEWNALDEHKYYRYDYYLDNCSTRVRDALDRVLGGAIKRVLVPQRTGTTYRSHTRRLTDGDVGVYTGIQLALGRPADDELSAWDESFLPVKLMEHLRRVQVPGPGGTVVPLVAAERQIFVARRTPEPNAPPSHAFAYALAGAVLGGFLLLFATGARDGRTGAGAAFGVVAGLWTLVNGLLGTAVLLAGTVTRHVFMGRNLNLAAFGPLAFVALVLVLAAVGARRPETRVRWAVRAARVCGLIAALTVVGWLGAMIIGQRSGEIFALAVPANVALWWACRTLSTARRA